MSSAASHTPGYEAVDLSTCAEEPIHIPGAIQPHGVLLALDEHRRVVTVSENWRRMLDSPQLHALGATLEDLLGSQAAADIHRRIEEWAPREPLVVRLATGPDSPWAGAEIDVVMHRSGGRLVVELEALGRPRSTMISYQSARSAMGRLASWPRIDGLAAQLAIEVRQLLRFDRVMVYRFDEDWNGQVIAEEKREDLNPFLGLRYPASDIPEQARHLYTVNWTRLIADISYEPVHLDPVADPATGVPLDLTHSVLRSVSPIHVEYLANMGVGASMSVSLLVDGSLWGLVACHHYSGPHRPGQDARSAAEFLGQVASQQIAELERAEARQHALEAQMALSRITARLAAVDSSPWQQLSEGPEVLDLVPATGAASCADGEISTIGATPDHDVLRRIAETLLGTDVPLAASRHLSSLDPDLEPNAEIPAGALAIGGSPDNWFMWLRPELREVVDWGGDPHNKAVYSHEGDEVRVSPRKSFDLWREVVRGSSAPWEPWELDVARDLGAFVDAQWIRRSRDQIVVAESLQRSVLPAATPHPDGLELAVRYLSASTYELGGDWWDCIDLPDGRFAVVIGDVAGHGVSAVAAMSQVSATLRAHLFAGASASRALDLLDSMMVESLPDHVATAVVAVVDIAARTIEVTTAGHPPPLAFHDGRAEELEVATRPLLGLGEGRSTSTTAALAPGSVVLLFSDGLVEQRGTDTSQTIADLGALGAATAQTATDLESWVDSLVAGAPGDGSDDRTVIALRLT